MIEKFKWWWRLNISNYFHKDHFLEPATSEVFIYEDFSGNKFHYQWGSPGWDSWGGMLFKDSQVNIESETLKMTTGVNPDPLTNSEFPRISGQITSAKFFNQKYFFYECCMKPCGQWDGIWMFHTKDQPGDVEKYEIDCMEMNRKDNNAFSSAIHSWGFDGRTLRTITVRNHKRFRKPLTDNYHVFAVDWQSAYIRFYIDSYMIWEWTGGIPDSPCFILANNQYSGGQLPANNFVKQIRVQKEKI